MIKNFDSYINEGFKSGVVYTPIVVKNSLLDGEKISITDEDVYALPSQKSIEDAIEVAVASEIESDESPYGTPYEYDSHTIEEIRENVWKAVVTLVGRSGDGEYDDEEEYEDEVEESPGEFDVYIYASRPYKPTGKIFR